LTEHRIAIQRAGDAAMRLDQHGPAAWTGVLKEFTRAHRRYRLAAAENGMATPRRGCVRA
jgi:hypothetical protein